MEEGRRALAGSPNVFLSRSLPVQPKNIGFFFVLASPTKKPTLVFKVWTRPFLSITAVVVENKPEKASVNLKKVSGSEWEVNCNCTADVHSIRSLTFMEQMPNVLARLLFQQQGQLAWKPCWQLAAHMFNLWLKCPPGMSTCFPPEIDVALGERIEGEQKFMRQVACVAGAPLQEMHMSTFLDWLLGISNILREPLYGEWFRKGIIHSCYDNPVLDNLLRERQPGTFLIRLCTRRDALAITLRMHASISHIHLSSLMILGNGDSTTAGRAAKMFPSFAKQILSCPAFVELLTVTGELCPKSQVFELLTVRKEPEPSRSPFDRHYSDNLAMFAIETTTESATRSGFTPSSSTVMSNSLSYPTPTSSPDSSMVSNSQPDPTHGLPLFPDFSVAWNSPSNATHHSSLHSSMPMLNNLSEPSPDSSISVPSNSLPSSTQTSSPYSSMMASNDGQPNTTQNVSPMALWNASATDGDAFANELYFTTDKDALAIEGDAFENELYFTTDEEMCDDDPSWLP